MRTSQVFLVFTTILLASFFFSGRLTWAAQDSTSTNLTTEKAFLSMPLEMPIVMSGVVRGKTTLSVGTPVQIVERRNGQVRIRTRTGGEAWVMEKGLTSEYVPRSAPASASTSAPRVATSGPSQWVWAIAPRYEEATPFGTSGFAWVKRQGKWFVINRQGKEVLQTPFERVAAFSEHGCAVGAVGRRFSEEKFGLVGPDGKLILEPEWDDVGELIRGFIPVKRDKKWGYTDADGKLVIPCEWEDAWRFSPKGTAIVIRDDKRGFINTKGKVLVEPVWDGAINHTIEGIGAVRRGDGWALIDQSGKLLCEPEWDMKWNLRRFDLGWIPVWKSDGGKIGLLGKNGKLLVPLEWDNLSPAAGGVFLYKADGESFFVGAEGKTIFTAPQGVRGIPEARLGFFDGLAMVSDTGEAGGFRHGFIDEQGKLIVPFRKGEFLPFSENRAGYRVDQKWGFIDRTGNEVVPPEWDEVRSFSENRAAVCRAGKWGFIDPSGKLIAEPQWGAAGDFSEGLAAVARKADGRKIWTFLKLDGSPAFTVDQKFHLRTFKDREASVTAPPAEFPRFRKGRLEGNNVLFDRAGRLSGVPVPGWGYSLAKLPSTETSRRWRMGFTDLTNSY